MKSEALLAAALTRVDPFVRRTAPHHRGRAKLGARDVDKILRVTESMVKSAEAQKEKTIAMLLRKAGYDVSPTTIWCW